MTTQVATSDLLSPPVRQLAAKELPPSMREAQEAIAHPDVQRMIEELAKFNLAVCMPHMQETGDFLEQPVGIVQVEVESEFVPAVQVAELGTLPVSWRCTTVRSSSRAPATP